MAARTGHGAPESTTADLGPLPSRISIDGSNSAASSSSRCIRSSALFSRQPSGAIAGSPAEHSRQGLNEQTPSPVTPETPAPPLTLSGAARTLTGALVASEREPPPGRPKSYARGGPKRGLSLAIAASGASVDALDAPPQTGIPPELRGLLSPKGANGAEQAGPAARDTYGSFGPAPVATPNTSSKERKRPARLSLAPPVAASSEAKSAPNSPMYLTPAETSSSRMGTQDERREDEAKELLRETLRGTPRRRPSMPFGRR